MLKPNDYIAFGDYASQKFYQKERYLKDDHKKDYINKDNWVDWLYKINQKITGNLKKNDVNYLAFKMGVDKHKLIKKNNSKST